VGFKTPFFLTGGTEKQETGYWEKFGYPSDGSIPGLKI
jgi:hypothetical protein